MLGYVKDSFSKHNSSSTSACGKSCQLGSTNQESRVFCLRLTTIWERCPALSISSQAESVLSHSVMITT